MQRTYKKIKVWQGILLLVLSVIEIFWVSGYLSTYCGLYGTLASELLLLALALLTVLLAKADFKEIFPIKQISVAGVAGTTLLWVGSFLIMMIVDLIIMAFFPNEMNSVGVGLGEAFGSVPFRVALFIVAMSPAICEEAVFRGVILHSFKPEKCKWLAIVVTGLLFGACHGSLWRFFPTAFLGIMMGYILVETDNMIYNGIFHFINNAVPVTLLFLMGGVTSSVDTGAALSAGAIWVSVGTYCIFGSVIPFSLYIGNYLIHYQQPGYRTSIFPKGKGWIIGVLAGLTVLFIVVGFAIVAVAIAKQPQMMQDVLEQVAL